MKRIDRRASSGCLAQRVNQAAHGMGTALLPLSKPNDTLTECRFPKPVAGQY
jgi:hypothetical protein